MKVVLFDLGKTLEDRDVLLAGTREMLQSLRAIRTIRYFNGEAVVLTLGSSVACYGEFSSRSQQSRLIRKDER
jgi:hypothetical protein